MKTYNQFLETPFSEEIAPPEPQEEDPGIKSKEKRQMQIKKMVLLKKMQAVRAGAGADIVAGYEPEGEVIDETNWEIHKLKTRYGDKSKLSKSSWYNQRRSKNPDLRQSKKEFRKSVEDDAAHEKKMGRSKPTPSNLKDSLKKQSKVKKVSEGTDKAFNFVLDKIRKEVGKDGYVSKDNPRKKQTDAEKAKVRAHQAKLAKQDHRDPTEKASDGRYSDRHSNRGSD